MGVVVLAGRVGVGGKAVSLGKAVGNAVAVGNAMAVGIDLVGAVVIMAVTCVPGLHAPNIQEAIILTNNMIDNFRILCLRGKQEISIPGSL